VRRCSFVLIRRAAKGCGKVDLIPAFAEPKKEAAADKAAM